MRWNLLSLLAVVLVFCGLPRAAFGQSAAFDDVRVEEANLRANDGFRISSASVNSLGLGVLTFPSRTNAYYVLRSGTVVTKIDAPIAAILGKAGENEFLLPPALLAGGSLFLRIQEIGVDSPLDVDGDGIDDQFELEHSGFLNLLDSRDARNDADGDGISNLDEYRNGTDPLVPNSPPLTTITESSPANGGGGVSVTRETIVRFSTPLDESAVVTSANFFASFGGRKLLGRCQLSADRKTATLFYLEPLPASTRVRVTFDGSQVAGAGNLLVDADGDGQPGGIVHIDFDTLGNTPVLGTAVIGHVYASEKNPDGSNQPLEHVTVTVDGAEETLRTTTDASGTFVLTNSPSGRFFVHVDGRTAKGSAWPNGAYYPFVGKAWEAVPGVTNNNAGGSGEIFLPLIREGTLLPVSAVAETKITFPASVIASNPALAGVEIMVPANSLFSDSGTRGGRVGIAPVPPDRLPEPLPPGLSFPLVITIQTDGPSNFDVPVPVRFPNLPDPVTGKKLGPGEKSALWSFDHDTGRWEIQGPMTVTADGNYVESDPGVGVKQPGWHGIFPGFLLVIEEFFAPANELNEGGELDVKLAALTVVARVMARAPGHGSYAATALTHFLYGDGSTLFYGQDSDPAIDVQGSTDFQVERTLIENELRQKIVNARDGNPQLANIPDYSVSLNGLNFYTSFPSQLALAVGRTSEKPTATVKNVVIRPDGSYTGEIVFQISDHYYFNSDHSDDNVLTAWAAELERAGIGKPFDTRIEFSTTIQAAVSNSVIPIPLRLAAQAESSTGINLRSLLTNIAKILTIQDYLIRINDSGTNATLFRRVDRNDVQVLITDSTKKLVLRRNAAASRIALPLGSGDQSLMVHSAMRSKNQLGISPLLRPIAGTIVKLAPVLLTADDSAPDSDSDGLSDSVEEILGTNPNEADTDGDGISDGVEVQQGADPLSGIPVQTGIIASATGFGSATDVVALNDQIVTANGAAGVTLYNVASLFNPVRMAQVDTPGSAWAVAFGGKRIAVADESAGLAIIDSSAGPEAKVNQQVSLGGQARAVVATADIAYVGLSSGVVAAVDLASGVVLDRVSTGPGEIHDLAIAGEFLYALTPGTFYVLPIGSDGLRLTGSVTSAGQVGVGGRRLRLFARENLIYLVHTSGYEVFDIAEPEHPRLISSNKTQQFGWRHFVLNGSGLGVGAVGPNSTEEGPHDVSLYEMGSDGLKGEFLTTFQTPGSASAVAIYNGLAYVADGETGLQVINYMPHDVFKQPPVISLRPSFAMLDRTNGVMEENSLTRITAVVHDDVQVRNVEFYLEGKLMETDGGFPFEYRFNAPRITANKANFSVRAKATDTGGNIAWSDEVMVTLSADRTAPRLLRAVPGAMGNDSGTVLVYFSEGLSAESFRAENISVTYAGPDLEVATADDEAVGNLVLSLRAPATSGSIAFGTKPKFGKYRLTVGTNVVDTVGNRPLQAMSTDFWILPRDSGLIAWWRAEGDVQDVFGGHDGTTVGTVSYPPGLSGTGFGLNGTGSIVIPDKGEFIPPHEFTVEGWIKVTGGEERRREIIAKGEGRQFSFGLDSLGRLEGREVDFLGAVGRTRLLVNTWYHVALTFGDYSLKAYLNGSLEAETNGFVVPSPQPVLRIGGGKSNGAGDNFEGIIDELALYRRALSQSELSAIYLAGPSGRIFAFQAVIIEPIADVTTTRNQPPKLMEITLGGEGVTNVVRLAATSDNQVLLPDYLMAFAGSGSKGFLQLSPRATTSGEAIVTVTAIGRNGESAQTKFKVTVLPVNMPPTIDPLPNLDIPVNSDAQEIPFTGISSGAPDEDQVLNITATTSNSKLITGLALSYESPGRNGTLRFTPAPDQVGSGAIKLTLTDNGGTGNGGTNTRTLSFTVSVVPTNRAVIVRPPKSQVVQAGEELRLEVEASGGAPYTYTWLKNGRTLTGMTNNPLVIPAATPGDAGSYTVRVVSSSRQSLGTSAVARVEVANPTASVRPIRVRGWNSDRILENTPWADAAPFDRPAVNGYGGNYWFEAGFQGHPDGLPASRVIASSSNTNVVFELQPYEANNMLALEWTNTVAELVLDAPQRFSKISLLAGSGGAFFGNAVFPMTLTFVDGSETNLSFIAPDWFTSSAIPKRDLAIDGLARVSLDSRIQFDGGADRQFSLHETDLDLTALGLAGRFLKGISFRGGNLGFVIGVFAVSGSVAETRPLDLNRGGSPGASTQE